MSQDIPYETVISKIKELETQYKELGYNLQKSRSKVIEDERALLECIQSLMPLQNTYLNSIIQNLSDQIKKKDNELIKREKDPEIIRRNNVIPS